MEMMARSVFAVRESMRDKGMTETDLQPIKPVLDSFYTSRIGIRILLGKLFNKSFNRTTSFFRRTNERSNSWLYRYY